MRKMKYGHEEYNFKLRIKWGKRNSGLIARPQKELSVKQRTNSLPAAESVSFFRVATETLR